VTNSYSGESSSEITQNREDVFIRGDNQPGKWGDLGAMGGSYPRQGEESRPIELPAALTGDNFRFLRHFAPLRATSRHFAPFR